MQSIWKYVLEVSRVAQAVQLPKGATILTVHAQDEQPCFWALVDTNAPTETRWFEVFGTGWGMPAGSRRYVGTGHTSNGFVWHVFEMAEVPAARKAPSAAVVPS